MNVEIKISDLVLSIEIFHLEILKEYHKKDTKSVKKIFITLFLLGALIYIVKFLIGFFK